MTPAGLAGLEARAVAPRNPQLAGASGTVVLETANMLHLETARGRRALPKDAASWEFSAPGLAAFAVAGADIAGRPQDRARRGAL